MHPTVPRDHKAERLIKQAHKLAIEQAIQNYNTKVNLDTYEQETLLHTTYGGTIAIVGLCLLILACIVWYCQFKSKASNNPGVTINNMELLNIPARKIPVKKKTLS